MRWATGALTCALILCIFSTVRGATTTVNLPIFSDEDNHQEVFSHVYGTTFTPSGVSYNGANGINAVRVDDSLDQIWQDNWESATVKAIFADNHQKFGYELGTSGGSFVQLIDATGTEYAVSGSANLTNNTAINGKELRWARAGTGHTFTSKPTDNFDGRDHMVTYQITGLNDNKKTWFLFFEDLGVGETPADFDYQDLVLKLTATVGNGTEEIPATPEPSSMAMLGLGSMLLMARRRR